MLLNGIVGEMYELILCVSCNVVLTGCTDVPFREEIDIQFMSDECPYSEVELPHVDECRYLYVLLDDEGMGFYDTGPHRYCSDVGVGVHGRNLGNLLLGALLWSLQVLPLRIRCLLHEGALYVPLLVLLNQLHQGFQAAEHMDSTASVQERRFQ